MPRHFQVSSKDKKKAKRKREQQQNESWRKPVAGENKTSHLNETDNSSNNATTQSTSSGLHQNYKQPTQSFPAGLSVFEQSQILEFKEAFSLIDADRDGIIDVDDLSKTFNSLGISKEQKELQDMIDEAMGPMNFSIFLNMLAERIGGVDPEDTLLEAFSILDEEKSGKIDRSILADVLRNQADRFTDEEIDKLMSICDVGDDDEIDYKALVHVLTHGSE